MGDQNHKNLKRFLIDILQFIPFMVILYLFIMGILANTGRNIQRMVNGVTNIPITTSYRYPTGQSLERFREVEKTEDIDILFIGSSHSYRTFDPRVFSEKGIKSFNLGSSSQTPTSSYSLLKMHQNQLKPKLVVFELFPGVMQSEGAEGNLTIIANHRFNSELIFMTLRSFSIKSINGLFTKILNFREEKFDVRKQRKIENSNYISGGFSESLHPEKARADWSFSNKEINQQQVKYLIKSTDFALENGAKVIWMVQPLPEKSMSTFTVRDQHNRYMDQLAAKENVEFLDFTRMIPPPDDSLYYDGHHLNSTGAVWFSKLALEYLEPLIEAR